MNLYNMNACIVASQVIYIHVGCSTEFVIVFLMGAYSGLFTDELSKVKADEVGFVYLMDCVFVKTDIGVEMTRRSTDDFTVSVSDTCMYSLSQRTIN